ncbi:MAG: pyridoxal phosphate-dependent aminotransferase [Candidatus Omnitrophica bacterium]|nr:pyridoxal phosphate-dependent aminotransferase [Candidatus Omnitrophota bacterium]
MIADRLRGVASSPTLALAASARALVKEGKPVLDFTAGEPDFPTPDHIQRAAVDAIEHNRTKYTPAAGILELRQAIANDLHRRLGDPVKYAPPEVMVCVGAKHALYNALQVLCDPGDEVLVFSPYWVSYLPLVSLAGAKPVLITTREEEHFQPDPSAVSSAITPNTKALILNSPSNPTGAVIEPQRLRALSELALARRVFVISDEIYDQLVFPPASVRSIVQENPKAIEWTILVNGVSKTYAMTGWRIGYAAGPKNVIDAMTALQSHSTSNPTSISQYAALAALTGDQADVRRMVTEFQRRRDHLVNGLNALPGLSCTMPDGAFYAWCNVSRLSAPADAVARRWLEEALIAVVPGEGFGSASHVRFSFAASLETIDQALKRLKQWLQKPVSRIS